MSARNWRLASGLVMLTYLTMHLFTHMLGIVSLQAAEAGLRVSMRIWQSAPGTALLYGAFALHFALALRTIRQRRHWQLPAVEWLRLWSGFSLPLLLIGHAVGTRVATSFYGFEPSYGKVIASLVASGSQGWQVALLAPGWVHGCLGLWLSLRQWAVVRRLRWLLLVLLFAVPVLSAVGFVRMSESVAETAAAQALRAAESKLRAPALAVWRHTLLASYLVLIALAAATGRWRESGPPAGEDGGTG